MNAELLAILDAIERDKGISREVLIEAVESALATAARKGVGATEEQEVTVHMDRTTGALSVFKEGKPVSGVDFSRIAAQTAKQVIIQKIREAERDVVYTEYAGRVGDIVTGTVHRFERGDVIIELGRAEAILPRSERIPREEYQQGERLQGYVLDVKKVVKGPSIIISRTHEGFIRGLFHLEVPEIAEGIVEIRGIAREAGDRTKIAVSSSDDKVDCVGACVGMRGTRVKNIVRELHGEKIDIIRWSADVREYIKSALQPAQIAQIQVDVAKRQALVEVEDDQLSLAIGKRGQNVRLASKLTGWELEIKSRTQLAGGVLAVDTLPGVDRIVSARLREAGIETVEQLAVLTPEQRATIPDLGGISLDELIEAAQSSLHNASTQTAQHTPEEETETEDAGTEESKNS
jgi:N utilization substance protein A